MFIFLTQAQTFSYQLFIGFLTHDASTENNFSAFYYKKILIANFSSKFLAC